MQLPQAQGPFGNKSWLQQWPEPLVVVTMRMVEKTQAAVIMRASIMQHLVLTPQG
jgi:hypothetical protein